jgi:inner membrane protein
MDNLTHAVTGLAAGELIHRALAPESDPVHGRTRRRLLLATGALAANFPDLDLLLTSLLPPPLGYLLHHRGHTHTLLYAIPQALLLAGLLWLLWPGARRLLAASKAARIGLWLALAAGFLSHILMDYLNSYGVHPFHPFDSRWLFGDMVFIVEPAFWIAFGTPLIMSLRQRELKAVLLAGLAGVLIFFTWRGFLAWGSLAGLLTAMAVLAALQWRDGQAGMRALIAAFALCTGFVAMQGMASSRADQVARELAQARDPGGKVLDVTLTAFPANPLCWIFISVERNEARGDYVLRRGIAGIAPSITPVAACPAGLAEQAMQRENRPGSAIFSEFRGPLARLRELQRTNCHFDAWLRFARVPWVDRSEATDVRFAASVRGNFTTMRLADFENLECSRYIPTWERPRADLLQPTPD